MLPKKRAQDLVKQKEKERGNSLSFSNYGLDKIPEQLTKSKGLHACLTELDFSCNLLSTIPDKIVRFTQLQSLNISKNKIIRFPDVICTMTWLRSLSINNNHISHIPPEIGSLKLLNRFTFAYNNIQSLPDELGRLQFLDHLESTGNPLHPSFIKVIIARLQKRKELDLTSLDMTKLPTGVLRLEKLEKLTLTANRIGEIDSDLLHLKHLKVLELRNNQITVIPAEFAVLTELEILGLAENLITNIPPEIQQLENLTFLNLSGNHLSLFPTAVCTLPNLHELFMNRNFPGFTEIPAELVNLKHLTSFHARANRISSVHVAWSSFPKLASLFLSNNPITILHPQELKECPNLKDIDFTGTEVPLLLQRIASCSVRKLPELNLSKLELESIVEMPSLEHVETIYLHNNSLERFPDALFLVTTLKQLFLANNNLSCLPDEISALCALEELDIAKNYFSCFPEPLVHCSSLRILKIGQNQIECLPDSFSSLKEMEEFYLSNNLIHSLAPLKSLPKLRLIHANENRIESLPDAFESPFLEEVHFSDNLLQSLPKSLGSCIHLHSLLVTNNQLTEIPNELFNIKSLKISGNYLSRSLTTIYAAAENNSPFLDLSEMGLREIECSVLSLPCLTSLDLSGNLFEHLELPLTSLSLSQLFLSSNQFSSLPPWIASMTSLSSLVLDNNPFRELPSCIFLPNLRTFSIRNCQLSALGFPPCDERRQGGWEQLECLDCTGNQITSFDPSFFISLPSLRTLRCGNNCLREFPHSLFQGCKELRSIQAQRNQLERLSSITSPIDVSISCVSLREIDVSQNSLKQLPIWLFKDCKLEKLIWEGNCNLPEYYDTLCTHLLSPSSVNASLDLSFNSLEQVPLEISVYGERMASLDLCGNNLTEFPLSISSVCKNLTFLNVSRNRLTDLSPCGKLESLVELRAMQNQIKIFPSELSSLNYVARIFLSFNQIEEIPSDLTVFPHLAELHITNNQLTAIPTVMNEKLFLNYRFNPVALGKLPVPSPKPASAFRSLSPRNRASTSSPAFLLPLPSVKSPKSGRISTLLKRVPHILSPRGDSSNSSLSQEEPVRLQGMEKKKSKSKPKKMARSQSSVGSNSIVLSYGATKDQVLVPKGSTPEEEPILLDIYQEIDPSWNSSPPRKDSVRRELMGSGRHIMMPLVASKNSRIYIKFANGDGEERAKAINLFPDITLNELLLQIRNRFEISSDIEFDLIVTGDIDWVLETNLDVAELVSGDIVVVNVINN